MSSRFRTRAVVSCCPEFFGRCEETCPLMQRQAERHADALRCLEQRAEEEHRALKRESSQLVKAAVATAGEKGRRSSMAK